jgi:hypothetical protein
MPTPPRDGTLLQQTQQLQPAEMQPTQQPMQQVGLQQLMHHAPGTAVPVIVANQEPSLRECIQDLPDEKTLPQLRTSSDFADFWVKFEKLAKQNAWPLALIPAILSRRASENIGDTLLEELPSPQSLKQIQGFLRGKFFPTIDYSSLRAKLQAVRQRLRESVADWETRLKKANDGRIDLDNTEGLLMYRNGVLPAYRFESGKNITEFLKECQTKEALLKDAYGDQIISNRRFVDRNTGDFTDQLTSFERTLMGTDLHRVLERLGPEDMETEIRRMQINNIGAAPTGTTTTTTQPPAGPKQCSHCSRTGHSESSCWRLHPELRPRKDQPTRPARPAKIPRLEFPRPQFPGQCVICAATRPEVVPHIFTECPYVCPTCGPGTHSLTLCPYRHGSGQSTQSSQDSEESE